MHFHEIAALVIFCATVALTVLLVLVPASIPLPARWQQRQHHHLLPTITSIPISYAAMPAVGTLVMLMTGVLDGSSLASGIAGDAHMKPYGIVILFMALAYMSASLDMTGCFQWLALRLTRMSRGNGLALFLLYYSLSSVITVFTSNDVSIMTLTPIIHYFSLATGADPIPFLTAEFTAANIWSMLLFVGNPTNIIVAMAYRLSFLEYTKYMALPTVAAGCIALCAVLLVHWRSIPRQLLLPDLQPSSMLVDKPGAVLGAINILTCLGLLAAAPALHWELWLVTLVCAVLHALYNFVAYVVLKGRWCSTSSSSSEQHCLQQQAQPHQPDMQPAAAGVAAGAGAGAAAAAMQACGHHVSPYSEATSITVELASICEQQKCCVQAGSQPQCTQQQQQQQPSWQPHGNMRHRRGCSHQQQQQPLPGAGTDGCARGSPPSNSQAVAGLQHTAGAEHGSLAVVQEGLCVTSNGTRSAVVDVEVSIGEEPGSRACSRTCSRQQLLTAQQRAECSDAAAACSCTAKEGCCWSCCCCCGCCSQQAALPLEKQQACCCCCCCGGVEASGTAASAAAAGAGGGGLQQESCISPAGLQPPPPPSFWRAVTVLPWEVVPFVLGMFCVVEGLNSNGWVDALARWLAAGLGGNVWGALFGVGGLSLLLANIINNQPMTILMTRVCMSPAFTTPVVAGAGGVVEHAAAAAAAAAVPKASAFAVVVASNTAANFSVMGALAGIMFLNILRQRGMHELGFLRFSKLMLPAGVASTLLALIVLGAQFVTWP